MTAKLKIILSIMMLTVILIMTTTLLSWKNFENSSTEGYKKQLGYKSQLIADTIEQKISRYFDVLSLASDELKFNPNGAVELSAAVKILNSARNTTNSVNVYFALLDGTSYSSKTNGLIENFNAKTLQREWFLKGMKGEERIITRPYTAKTGDNVMALARPIYKKGKIVGVIALNLILNDLSQFTKQLTANNKVFVTREDGFILAAKNPSLIGKNIYNEIPYLKTRDTSKEESFEYVHHGIEYLGSAAKLRQLNWSVWAWNEEVNVKRDSQDNLVQSLFTSLILLLISAGCVYFIVEQLVYRPIGGEPSEIEETVSKIARGDFTAIKQDHGNAIGINAAVISMVSELSSTIQIIRGSSDELLKFAEGITQTANNMNLSSATQMEQLEQTSTAMNEMSVAVDEVAQNAH
ncbi:methyl-accepting chemotaxis protein, partial [Moritella sp. JT01]|uniref:methyl-accepting chemotaxis protein n=1 Tax=Moritella sp. JT01 TaxID=756698 RepID=UPI0018DD9C79